ncbi:MAG: FtsW/RodA/SpoVE family cell cycle protein, partial [Coriobacteriales bacterium]
MRTKRNIELALLVAALPVLIVLFATLIVTSNEPLSVQSFSVPLGLFVAFVAAHVAVRRFAPEADPALLPITLLLSGIGIAFVLRLAPDQANRQVVWLFVSIVAMILVLVFVPSVERLAQYKFSILLCGLVFLLLPAIIGTEINGSKIWLSFGGFSFQPGELAKVLIVIFLGAYLAENRELLSVPTHRILRMRVPEPRTFIPLLFMWGVSLLIVVFEHDLGSALLFFGVFLFMIYVCTGRLAYVIIGVALILVGFVGAYFVFGHVRTRVQVWLHPFDYSDDQGYQLVQAIYSMTDGGLVGVGIGRGLCTRIPVVASDFIFAAIAEEMGLLGAAGVLILYILFTVRGFLTAARAKTDVAAFIATGLTCAISFQAFVIVGGVTRLIPLTGLTLPFMSQGGSSLLASFIILGLLLKAGNEGTGIQTDLVDYGYDADDTGVLGRVTLGSRLTKSMTFLTVLFALLIANLTYIQVIKAKDYQDMPSNNHTIARAQEVRRGTISTSDGVVLAQSELSDDGKTYVREYPQGSLAAHVVGYSSVRYGSSGVESTQNSTLTGNANYSTWTDALESLAGAQTAGNDITLTIDSDIQRAAEDALDGQTGAIVALDPSTGAILALASSPTYDPSDIASELQDASSDALYNRATQALYAPGSTFKIVTLSAALDTGTATPSTTYDSPSSMDIGGAPVTNYDGESFGTITLDRATCVSSNTVFGQVAVDLGARNLVDYAQRYGFNSTVGRDLSVTTSLMPKADEMTTWETAWSGVGQPVGEHESPAGPQTTVLQMAMVGATVANDGVTMNPYVVSSVASQDGTTTQTTTPQILSKTLSTTTAHTTMDVL